MDAITMLRERRSIRRFKQEKVERDIMKEIIETASFAPSWSNFQIARYTVVDNEDVKTRIGEEGYNGFEGNIAALNSAAGVVILSYVKGKSGHKPNAGIASEKGDTWSMFDAGIAAHQFCLAAHEKGVGTVIQGIFDEKAIAKIINLPEDEIVAAVIPYGFIEKIPRALEHGTVEQISRFI
ncbi:MAG: nitroreductase family protein [Sedimentibacter sp.]